MSAPVILIGMHRSGTSMLARLLGELGLFLGERRDENDEALFFQRINDWILRSAGGSWERPEALDALLAQPVLADLTRDYVAGILRSPHTLSYLGLSRWLGARSPAALKEPWGFKDPRATFTLPIWLALYPEARVIHVRRHGVDVAASLKLRQERALEHARARHRRRGLAYWLFPKRGAFAHTVRALELAGGLELWEQYTARAEQHTRDARERGLEVVYEDFLADPLAGLERVARFAGLAPDARALARAAAGVRRERAQAFRESPELLRVAAAWQERLAALGYPAEPPRAALHSTRASRGAACANE